MKRKKTIGLAAMCLIMAMLVLAGSANGGTATSSEVQARAARRPAVPQAGRTRNMPSS